MTRRHIWSAGMWVFEEPLGLNSKYSASPFQGMWNLLGGEKEQELRDTHPTSMSAYNSTIALPKGLMFTKHRMCAPGKIPCNGCLSSPDISQHLLYVAKYKIQHLPYAGNFYEPPLHVMNQPEPTASLYSQNPTPWGLSYKMITLVLCGMNTMCVSKLGQE